MMTTSGGGGDHATEERSVFEHSGWVYHLGTNKLKREYCHRRYLHIKGKYVMMYKRNPHEHPTSKPIRRGVVGHTLVLEELGRRKVNDDDLYVLKFSNRLDEEKKGEIACATAGETRKWMEALEQAKKQAEYELSQSSNTRNKLSMENEINLGRHGRRRRVKQYASGVKRLISTKRGESLVRRSLSFGASRTSVDFCEADTADVVEEYEWKCVRTSHGVRIFEDVSGYKGSKGVLVKAVGVMEASTASIFEEILSLDRHQRYEWDVLTSDLELVDSITGSSDVIYGTYDPRYLTRWKSLLQFPAVHKKRPAKSGYRRIKINRLKAYMGAKSAPKSKSSTNKEVSSSNNEFEDDDEVADDFYDAISACPSSDDDDDDNEDDDSDYDESPHASKGHSMKRTLSCLDQKRISDPDANDELDPLASPLIFDPSQFHGSMREGKSETDTNCWTNPNGTGFMIRGKTYLTDNTKVPGGDPLLKLIAVDWFKVDRPVNKVALHPKSLLQSEAGKTLPFVLVMNLQVPAKPNYSLVLYFAADRPVVKDSLLGRFIDETNTFRDSRFKLIPSIVEGYWMVKRAVGTKACLLGKAVTCNYVRRDNFLEIDVDVGSSSVARSVIGIVLGYVTSIVVDLAIIIEGKEQVELPEYILGTVRLNRVRLESAVRLES
ncbi:enhanced disease resistance 2-like protein isoform X3 [Tanacetum coccineum]